MTQDGEYEVPEFPTCELCGGLIFRSGCSCHYDSRDDGLGWQRDDRPGGDE